MTGLDSLKNKVSAALANKQFDIARDALKKELQSLDEECLMILGRLEAQQGNYSAAVENFQRAVSKGSKTPDAYYYLGAALKELDRTDEALAAYQITIDLNSSHDKAHCNMGTIYFNQADYESAQNSYRAAIIANSGNVDAYNNLGLVLKGIKNYTGAHECFKTVLAIRPGNPETYYNIGRVYSKQKNMDRQAKIAFQKAVSLALSLKKKTYHWSSSPEFVICSCYAALAEIARRHGNKKHAIACYKKALKIDPEHESSLHFLAALGEIPQPSRASDGYVANLFDEYAESFDSHLVTKLKYRTPELLCEMVRKKLNTKQPVLDIIDLGCGTGLCGPLLRPIARSLIGIDLSPKMIACAKRRALYDDLHVSEIGAALQNTRAEYDLAIAADVLVYFGDLEPFFSSCYKALRPGGWLAISLEKAEKDHVLTKSGRYTHSERYVTEMAQSCGFDIAEMATTDIRVEYGKPVTGFLVLAQSQASGDDIRK